MKPEFTVRCVLVIAVACLPSMVQAQQTTIYRCHALKGDVLIFQDKPCDQVAGTKEALKGSAGDIIPNAPAAPETDGPPLTERYETYLDKQSERRASEAAATPAPAQAQIPATSTGSGYGYPGVPAVGAVDGYGGYSEGVYPYPAYPAYPPYYDRGHRPHDNNGNGAAPTYSNNGPQALPKPLPLPSSSFPQRPQRTAPPASAPGTVVTRDPSR